MYRRVKFSGDILRWLFLILGALLFVYGFGWGRWDAAIAGLFLMQFGIAISLKLRIMELRERVKELQR
jgi:hypothetical protein